MTKKQIERLEILLDDNYKIAKFIDKKMGNENNDEFLPSNPNFIFYRGIIETIETMDLNWERRGEKHYIYN